MIDIQVLIWDKHNIWRG